METLLGSCVAVVLTDPRRTVGTMCHIVHCDPAGPRHDEDTAHVSAALVRMGRLLQIHGLHAPLCEAYVYGGGNMFPHIYTSSTATVGERNVSEVGDRLRRMGVRVLCQDVGGDAFRRLRWTVGTTEPSVTAVTIRSERT